MSINLQTGGYTAPQILPGARSTDIQVAQKQPVQNPEYSLPAPGSVSPEDQRYEQVFFASKAFAGSGDVFAVSDKSFTIFKDAGGQYVTRYTSLRDGKVTYVPELKLIQFFGAGQPKNQEPIVQLQA